MNEYCRNYTFMWVLEWSDVKIKNALGQGVKGEIYELQKGSRTAKCQKDCSRRRINFCDHLFIVKSFMSAHSFLNTFIRSFIQADMKSWWCLLDSQFCLLLCTQKIIKNMSENLIWLQKWTFPLSWMKTNQAHLIMFLKHQLSALHFDDELKLCSRLLN